MKKTVVTLVEHEAGDAFRRTAPVVEDKAGEVLKRAALLLAGQLLVVTVAVATTLNALAARFEGGALKEVLMTEVGQLNSMPDGLQVYGDAATRELHQWFVYRVLISDNEANALRMSGKTFAQDERYVLYYRLLCRSEFLPIPSPSEKEMNLHVN